MRGIVNLASISGLGIGGRGAVVSGFSPNNIAGLKIWLDASDTSTLTLTGSSVDSWTDKVAGHVFAQSVAGSKPTSGATVNGLNAITFDGSDDYLNKAAGNILTGSQGIVFTVIKTPAAFPAGNAGVFATGSDSSPTTGAFCAVSGYQVVTGVRYNRLIEKSSAGDAQTTIRGSATQSTSTTYILAQSSSGSAYGLRNNGVAETINVVAGADNGNWWGNNTGVDNTTVGAILRAGSLANIYSGVLCEVLAYDAVTLSAGQISQVETYLATKWGVTI